MQGLPRETKGWLNKYVLAQLRLGKQHLWQTLREEVLQGLGFQGGRFLHWRGASGEAESRGAGLASDCGRRRGRCGLARQPQAPTLGFRLTKKEQEEDESGALENLAETCLP